MASYNEIFQTNFKILKVFGLWTLETDGLLKKKLYNWYRRCLVFIIMIFVIQQYTDLYIIRHDVEKITFNICMNAGTTIAFFKIVRFNRILPGVASLRGKLNRNADEKNDEECKNILSRAAYEMKSLNILVHSTGCIFAVTMYIFSFFNQSGTRSLPLRQWYPFDIKISPNYELVFLYQVLITFSMATIAIDIDLSALGIMISMAAEYEILKRKIEKSFSEMYKQDVKGVQYVDQSLDEESVGIIKDLAVRHQEITGQVIWKF